MAQIPPIDDAYINEIIKSNGPYNPALLTTQGLKLRELIKLLRDRMEQGDAEAVHKTGDESILGTKTFTLIKSEGLSVNNLANPSLDTVISPVTGVQTKFLNITEGAFSLQLSASVLAASRSQLLQDKDGVIALTEDLSDFLTLSQFNEELALKIDITAKGVAGGVSTLDSGGKIPASQLPDSISGALIYQGTWDADTNVPALVDPPASSTKGYYYVTSIAGTQFGITLAVGDWIVSNGTAWEKVDNSDAVTTVFGRLGNVLANEEDYSPFYPLLSGRYANPSWLTSIDYSKITNAPNGSGIYTADGILTSDRLVNGDNHSLSFHTLSRFSMSVVNDFSFSSGLDGPQIASEYGRLTILGSRSFQGFGGGVDIYAGGQGSVNIGTDAYGGWGSDSGVVFTNLRGLEQEGDSLLGVDWQGKVKRIYQDEDGTILLGKMFTYTASGDNIVNQFLIPHGLSYIPTMVMITPNSPDAIGFGRDVNTDRISSSDLYAYIDGVNVIIKTRTSVPFKSGTNNLQWTILVK